MGKGKTGHVPAILEMRMIRITLPECFSFADENDYHSTLKTNENYLHLQKANFQKPTLVSVEIDRDPAAILENLFLDFQKPIETPLFYKNLVPSEEKPIETPALLKILQASIAAQC